MAGTLMQSPVHAHIPVVDAERAKRFYIDTLGLTMENDDMFPYAFMLKGADGTKLLLYQRSETKADHTVAGFVCDDLEASVDALTQQGIVFEQYELPGGIKTNEKGIATMGSAKAAWFKDTEGNILALNNKI